MDLGESLVGTAVRETGGETAWPGRSFSVVFTARATGSTPTLRSEAREAHWKDPAEPAGCQEFEQYGRFQSASLSNGWTISRVTDSGHDQFMRAVPTSRLPLTRPLIGASCR